MSIIWTITKKELRTYFNSPLGYIFIDLFLVFTSFFFFQSYFLYGQADMRGFFSLIPWVFLFLIPALTMRLWAEERKLGTVEILLTLPVKDHEVVLGKFFSTFLFLAVTLACSLIVPLLVRYTGQADVGVIAASYLGTLLLGGAYVALGLWISSYTDNQIIAFIVSILVSFFFFIIGEVFILQRLPDLLVPLFQNLGLGSHFSSISRGVIDSRDILYYFSFIGLFLFLNVRAIAGRRFR